MTEDGIEFARGVGRRLGERFPSIRVLTGETLRTRQTAQAIAAGASEIGAAVDGPHVAFALRNPDLYVAGQRVDMVSSFAAVAEQLEGIDEASAAEVPFFRGFIPARDRIGWWLEQDDPPGDGAESVASRIEAFAASLADYGHDGLTFVGVTHSPILRAVGKPLLGRDPGEPEWVAGLSADISTERTVSWTWLDSAP